MEAIERDYEPKGVDFYYVYKSLAHPELRGFVQPVTIEERLAHVEEAQRQLRTRFVWLADNMANDLKHAFGDASNSEFIVDPDGKIVRRRMWSDPDQLRADLVALVGVVENTTSADDVDVGKIAPSATVATGVVPRVMPPDPTLPLRTVPHLDDTKHPFYVKLRAEADERFFETGDGVLYIGFHLDPIHEVHWNNLADPLEFAIEPPEGVSLEPESGRAPKVAEAADADPREFLLKVQAGRRDAPLSLTVRYYACDNANTFCVPVRQSYDIHLEPDADAGRVNGRNGRGRSDRAGGRGRPSGGRQAERFQRADVDGDGRISRDEARGRLHEQFDRIDRDGDSFLDPLEIEGAIARTSGRASGRFDRLLRFDADGDGRISRSEAPEPLRRRFDRMDANGDGYITQEEMAGGERRSRDGGPK